MLKIRALKGVAIIGLCVLLIALLFWLVLGPFISLYRIQVSLENGDSTALPKVIDFPVLRENVKWRAKQRIEKSLDIAPAKQKSLLSYFVLAGAEKLIDLSVDAAISPVGLNLMLSGEDFSELFEQNSQSKPTIFKPLGLRHFFEPDLLAHQVGSQASSPKDKTINSQTEQPSNFISFMRKLIKYKDAYDYKSASEFVFYLPEKPIEQVQKIGDDKHVPYAGRQLIFIRSGLFWKLSDITL